MTFGGVAEVVAGDVQFLGRHPGAGQAERNEPCGT
jgi:hypothetical protein